MKFSKGKIGNLNKKILIGMFAFTLSTTTLTGCKAYGFDYKKNSEGIHYATGSVDDKFIKDCYYIEIYNEMLDTYENYIVVKQNVYNKINYFDIFTLDTLYIENDNKYSNIKITNIISIDEYLSLNNNKKNEYSVEFMEKLFEQINQENTNKTKKIVN